MTVELRRAGLRDVFRLRRWRNDPVVRQQSLSPRTVGLAEHLRWCWDVAIDACWSVHIVEADGVPVGYARFVLDCGSAFCSVALEWRGDGIGKAAIDLLCGEAAKAGAHHVVADVLVGNEPSLRAFGACGFERQFATPRIIRLTKRCA